MKLTQAYHSSTLWPAAMAIVLATMIVGAATGSDVPTSKNTYLVTVKATIEAIDQDSRQVTLKGPLGNTVTFVAGQQIRNLAKLQAGDSVVADYYVSLLLELREPTEEEKQKPLMVVEPSDPGDKVAPASGLPRIRVVATIEGLDLTTKMVTVKGPRGRVLTVRAASQSRLERLQIGQTVVITCTEAVAVSLEKAGGKTSD